MLTFYFKVVRTEINRVYQVSSTLTVKEFIKKIKTYINTDPQLTIDNFELVPLSSTEDGPALQSTDELITTIYNHRERFLYIRPIQSISRSNCVICLSNQRQIAFVPCGHLCICRNCSNNGNIIVCPICRNQESSRLEIFDP